MHTHTEMHAHGKRPEKEKKKKKKRDRRLSMQKPFVPGPRPWSYRDDTFGFIFYFFLQLYWLFLRFFSDIVYATKVLTSKCNLASSLFVPSLF